MSRDSPYGAESGQQTELKGRDGSIRKDREPDRFKEGSLRVFTKLLSRDFQ